MSTEQASVTERVMAEITRGIEAGMTITEACSDALGWIKLHGLAEEVLAEIGSPMLADIWRHKNAAARAASLRGSPEPGERRVNAKLLNSASSLYESLWPIDGHYKPLGEMVQADCRELGDMYESLAASNDAKAKAFRRLQRRLSGAAKVRDRFNLKTLKAIFKDVGDGE